MALPNVTLEGNLAADPELRFLPTGAVVCNFRVGTGERKFNREANRWEDGRPCWVSVTCWRDLAENVAESLHRGDKVVVTGRLYEETYTPNGSDQPRTVMKMEADAVGASLRNATAQVRRVERQGQQQGQQQGQGQPQGDPWARPAQGQQPDWSQQQQAPQQGQQQGGWGQQPPPQQGWGQQQQGGWGQPPAGDGQPAF